MARRNSGRPNRRPESRLHIRAGRSRHRARDLDTNGSPARVFGGLQKKSSVAADFKNPTFPPKDLLDFAEIVRVLLVNDLALFGEFGVRQWSFV